MLDCIEIGFCTHATNGLNILFYVWKCENEVIGYECGQLVKTEDCKYMLYTFNYFILSVEMK